MPLSCRLRLGKWYAQLLLSRKSQLEPASNLDRDIPQSEVTLVADRVTNQIRFKSFLQQSTSALSPQSDLDQGEELMGVVPTKGIYNECKHWPSRPDHSSTFLPSDSYTSQ